MTSKEIVKVIHETVVEIKLFMNGPEIDTSPFAQEIYRTNSQIVGALELLAQRIAQRIARGDQ